MHRNYRETRKHFQVVLACGNLLVNMYCIAAVFAVETLRRMDFYFVVVQAVVDFLIGGVYCLVFGLYQFSTYLDNYCEQFSWFKNHRAIQFIDGLSSFPGEDLVPCRVSSSDADPDRWQPNYGDRSKATSFFLDITSSRDIFELITHYAQCFLVFGILICHAAWATQHYKRYVRIAFYFLITIDFIIPS